jgi:taurine dioxygenase
VVAAAMATVPENSYIFPAVTPWATKPSTSRRSRRAFHIDGLPKEESGAILNYLFEHCTRPEFQVRFRWRPHSVTFRDNRSVQHMALWDYYPQVRSGRRVTIKGDRPF